MESFAGQNVYHVKLQSIPPDSKACYENPLFEEDGTVLNETHTKLHKQPDAALRTKPYDLNNAAQTAVHYKQSKPKKRRFYVLGAIVAFLAIIAIAVTVIIGQRADDGKSKGSRPDGQPTTVGKVFLFETQRVEGRLRVRRGPFSEYKAAYSNSSSVSFSIFSSSFTYQMNIIFTSSSFSSSYSHTDVVNISSGSVIVEFVLHFRYTIPIYTTSHSDFTNIIIDGIDDTLFIIDESSVSITPIEPAITVITTSKPGVCVQIQSPRCASVVGWNSTTFPNILGHTSPHEVDMAEYQMMELVMRSCSKDFWCSVFNPKCVNNRALPPCRSYCLTVFENCHYGTNISSVLDCNSLPESNDPTVCQQDPYKPGQCLPLLDARCAALGYNQAAFPNFAGHRNPFMAGELMMLIDHINNATHCYKYSYPFVCYTMMPKCSGAPVPHHAIPPCRSLCNAFKSRCAIFLDIFWQRWPESLYCDSFPDSSDPSVCLGYALAHEPPTVEECQAGEERCDGETCIPLPWKCDGYQDCKDGKDESEIQTTQPLKKCVNCPDDMYRCEFQTSVCIENAQRCDGTRDCPTESDERDCVQMNNNGLVSVYTLGPGSTDQWSHICTDGWTEEASRIVCNQLGYKSDHVSTSGTFISSSQSNLFQLTTQRNGTDDHFIASRLRPISLCPSNRVVTLTCGHPICGIRPAFYPPAIRVVGGDIANPNAWPWHVSVFGGADHKYFCGGTIIDKDWILTAGHCLGGLSDPSHMLLRAGQPRRDTYSMYTQELHPAQLILHPFYDLDTVENDIALIRLNNSIHWNDHVRPVCLPQTSEKLLVGTRCTVIGWGKQGDKEPTYERQIRQVNLEVTDWHACKYGVENAAIKVPYKLTDQMFCAGGGRGHDSCSGDSGGPFLCQLNKTEDTWFVAGIVSWGVACAYPNVPGVYTNVPGYLDWIRNVTGLQHL